MRILTIAISSRPLFLVSSRERKIKFPIAPFQIQAHWLLIFSLSGIAIAFLLGPFCVLRTWLGSLRTWNKQAVSYCICRQLNHQVWGGGGVQKYGWTKYRLYSMCGWGPAICQLSEDLSKFFLSEIFGSGSESWKGSILCSLLHPRRVVQYCPEYLLFVQLKPDIFERTFQNIFVVKSWPNWKLIIRAW